MIRTFLVSESKLAAFIDQSLKLNGLALHAPAQDLMASLVVHSVEQAVPVESEAVSPCEIQEEVK